MSYACLRDAVVVVFAPVMQLSFTHFAFAMIRMFLCVLPSCIDLRFSLHRLFLLVHAAARVWVLLATTLRRTPGSLARPISARLATCSAPPLRSTSSQDRSNTSTHLSTCLRSLWSRNSPSLAAQSAHAHLQLVCRSQQAPQVRAVLPRLSVSEPNCILL